jgi:hypothetical protein
VTRRPRRRDRALRCGSTANLRTFASRCRSIHAPGVPTTTARCIPARPGRHDREQGSPGAPLVEVHLAISRGEQRAHARVSVAPRETDRDTDAHLDLTDLERFGHGGPQPRGNHVSTGAVEPGQISTNSSPPKRATQ